MAILNFPNSGLAANVTQYTGDNGITYTWDGVKWIVQSAGIVGTISYTDLTNKPTSAVTTSVFWTPLTNLPNNLRPLNPLTPALVP